jgi:hypothetical protein
MVVLLMFEGKSCSYGRSFTMWLPKRSGPACQRLGERFICSDLSQLRQKPLGVAIAVGKATTSEQGQSLATVATEIPRSLQSHGFQKEQGQHLTAEG